MSFYDWMARNFWFVAFLFGCFLLMAFLIPMMTPKPCRPGHVYVQGACVQGYAAEYGR